MKAFLRLLAVLAVIGMMAGRVHADSFFFSTGAPDGKMATGSRPGSAGVLEIESADDFVLTSATSLSNATFTGLLPAGLTGADVTQVRVEIYRVFPKDSDTVRTPNVPTRTNSPSDVEFVDRDSAASNLSFSTTLLNSTFSANNSVLNGINPKPNQTTKGEGTVTGQEFQFNVTFTSPLVLPADHYFFVPQVMLSSGDFFWLSAPRPISGAGTTPFPPGFTDLQEWIRNENLAPDWLRVGTDIVGGTTPPTFNASFSLTGQTVPEPTSVIMLALGAAGVFVALRICRKRRALAHGLAAR
jgi:hypothetical protein